MHCSLNIYPSTTKSFTSITWQSSVFIIIEQFYPINSRWELFMYIAYCISFYIYFTIFAVITNNLFWLSICSLIPLFSFYFHYSNYFYSSTISMLVMYILDCPLLLTIITTSDGSFPGIGYTCSLLSLGKLSEVSISAI